jgi:hypothetical protein
VIRIEGENPIEVIKRARHHARGVAPLAYELVVNLFFSELAADRSTHRFRSIRGGPNSWCLSLDRGPEYHFRGIETRGKGYDHIKVYRRYQRCGLVATLRDEQDVRKFVRSLSSRPGPLQRA